MASNTLEEAIVTKMKATSNITDYVGTGVNARIYWISAPANTTTLPYIVLTSVSRQNDAQIIGERWSQARVQCSIWHDNKRNGQDLAENIVTVFDQYSGALDDYNVMFGTVTGPVQLEDPDSDELIQFVIDLNLNFKR